MQLRYRNPKREPEKQVEKKPDKIPFYQPTGHDAPTPMEPPEKTKYSMKGVRSDDERLQENKRKRSRKLAPLREADPHTVWVRKDIWAALILFKDREKRSLRSCVEEALYNFLIKEKRVVGTEDLGEDENASWTKP